MLGKKKSVYVLLKLIYNFNYNVIEHHITIPCIVFRIFGSYNDNDAAKNITKTLLA